jgi:hypothetical protein
MAATSMIEAAAMDTELWGFHCPIGFGCWCPKQCALQEKGIDLDPFPAQLADGAGAVPGCRTDAANSRVNRRKLCGE